jgi:hypothetical protein
MWLTGEIAGLKNSGPNHLETKGGLQMTDQPVKKISLDQIARAAMAENGLEADFSPDALSQLDAIQDAATDDS